MVAYTIGFLQFFGDAFLYGLKTVSIMFFFFFVFFLN